MKCRLWNPCSAFVLSAALLGCAAKPIIPPDATIEPVATGYKFTEGPAADPQGRYIYFSDIPNQAILRYNVKAHQADIYRQPSGAANGLMFDKQGRLYAAEGGFRSVTRTLPHRVEVLADRFENQQLNSPNDLVLDKHGGVYFTDPRYGPRDNLELQVEAVYYIDKKGTLRQIIADLQRPNGIILSPNEKTLYVADNAAKKIMAYRVEDPGWVTDPRVFAEIDLGGADGLTVDRKGNVYAALPGHICIWNKKGELLQKVAVPENPANLAFGGRGSRMLYITATKSLYCVKTHARGIR